MRNQPARYPPRRMTSAPTSWLDRSRKGALPLVMWGFGFATTLLLIGMWGRTVTVDSSTVSEAAKTVVDADVATERIYDWLEAGIATATGAAPTSVEDVSTAIAQRPEFDAAVDAVVDQFVAGLFAEPGTDAVVDVEAALDPLVPVVVAEANRRNVPVEAENIERALDAATMVALDTGQGATVATAVRETRTFLSVVVVIAAAAMVVTAMLAVALSDRRYAMVRTLSVRVLISAMTYALLFRVGAWALDPQRGRSPVLNGGSVLLGSNGHVFLIAAVVAAVVGAWGGLVAWRRTKVRKAPAVADLSDDDTREFATV